MTEEKKLKIDIMVTEASGTDVRGAVARRFIAGALQAGHHVGRVLFYADGVYVVLPGAAHSAWRRLGRRHRLELALCPAALERRGLSSIAEDAGFSLIGLPAWLDSVLDTDRLLRF